VIAAVIRLSKVEASFACEADLKGSSRVFALLRAARVLALKAESPSAAARFPVGFQRSCSVDLGDSVANRVHQVLGAAPLAPPPLATFFQFCGQALQLFQTGVRFRQIELTL